jgi:vacuolar-type H+-ATPase subunit H
MDMVLSGSEPLGNEKNRESVPDELNRNYREMDESGKEEFLKETERILEVYRK